MNKTVISVVLGSYNRLDFLKLAVSSIRKELLNFSYETIIVDGGSTDGTLEWLLDQKDLITIIQHNRGEWQGKKIERRSWGYFMNLGFKCAQGKYVCMLSDDCLIVPGAIKNGYQLFEDKLNEGKKIGALAFYFRDWSIQENYYVSTPFNKMFVNHGLYLKTALDNVNYIDEETYLFYGADADLCLKMLHNTYECIDSPNSFIEHYPHANLNVRKSNYSEDELSLKPLQKKWAHIFPEILSLDPNTILEKKFHDPNLTGNQFETLHKKTVKSNFLKKLNPKHICKDVYLKIRQQIKT